MESRPRAGRVAMLILSHCRCPAPPHALAGKEKNTTALQGVCLDPLFLTGPLSVHEKGSVETKYGGVGTTARPQARSCTQKVMKAGGVGAGAPLWKPHPGVNRNEEYWRTLTFLTTKASGPVTHGCDPACCDCVSHSDGSVVGLPKAGNLQGDLECVRGRKSSRE